VSSQGPQGHVGPARSHQGLAIGQDGDRRSPLAIGQWEEGDDGRGRLVSEREGEHAH
jgi:hypothetical protein